MKSLFSHDSVIIGEDKVHVAFTSQAAGNLGLHVGDPCQALENRYRLEDELALPAGRITYLNQVHGTDLATDGILPAEEAYEVSAENAQRSLEQAPVADAAVSSSRALGVLVADCIPLVLLGQTKDSQTLLAVAHAGRKGLLDGVIQCTIDSLIDQGALKIWVWIGPSICGSCYEVPEKLQAESEKVLPGISSTTAWGTPALDLPRAAQNILEGYTQVLEVYSVTNVCTLETAAVSSHRRGDQSRIAGIIWKEPA